MGYREMGHMTKLNEYSLEQEKVLGENKKPYYLPHHGVNI